MSARSLLLAASLIATQQALAVKPANPLQQHPTCQNVAAGTCIDSPGSFAPPVTGSATLSGPSASARRSTVAKPLAETGVTASTGGIVYYVDAGQTIHQMYYNGTEWEDINLMASSQSGMQVALGSDVTVDSNGFVYYADAGETIHQMWWGGSQWVDANLMASSQSGITVQAGSNVTVDAAGSVYYVSSGQTVHKMWWGGSQWLDADLMASSGTSYRVESYTGVTVDNNYGVYFVSTGLTVEKMWWNGSQFVDADLMASSLSGLTVQPWSQVAVDANDNIYYVATAQAVHEMYWGTSHYVDVNLNASSPVEPGTSPTVDSSANVYYVDTGQTIHKMWISGSQWVDANIMASAQSGSVVVPGGGVAVDGNGYMYYVDPGQTIQEMYWANTQFADANLMASSQSGLRVSVAFLISGQVTNGGAGLNGVTVTLSGTTPSGATVSQTTITATVSGNDGEYAFLVPDGGTYTLALSDANGDTFQSSISLPLASMAGSQAVNFTNNGNGGYEPGPYPTDPAAVSAPAGSCNITGTWNDNASALTWQIIQNGNSISGTGTFTPRGCSTTITWTAAGSISGNLASLTASNPSPATQACAGFQFNSSNPITAAVALSSCSSGAATETARESSSSNGFLGGGSGGSTTVSGSGPWTLASNPITFQIISSSAQAIQGISTPVIPMSTGDANVQVTTTSSVPSYSMTSVYSAAFQSNPNSQTCTQGTTGGATLSGSATGQGSATGALTASPAGCSGIFTIWGNVGGTTTKNTLQVIVPPQIMIQTEVGEAGAQTQAGDDTMAALLLTARNRFGDRRFPGGKTATWQSVLDPTQYYGASNTTANGVQPELNYAASVFSGASTVNILNCEALWSPTNDQYLTLQSLENTPASAVSDDTWRGATVGAPDLWRYEPKQAVIKSSIANNRGEGESYNAAPAFVLFRQAPSGTSPAVIVIP